MSDEEIQELQERLATSFPKATKSECYRFLKARKGSLQGATKQLEDFLEWRELHQLDQPLNKDDAEIWKHSSIKATAHDTEEGVELPRVVRTYLLEDDTEACALDKTLVIQVLPAQIDIKIAPAATYALAMALYVYYKADRDSIDKVTVLLDVRAGTGWPNEPAYNLIGFIKTVSSLLNQHFPERLQRLLLYPMPTMSLYLWGAVKRFLDEDTTTKIKLIGGPANENSPAPEKELLEYMDKEVLNMVEEGRKEACNVLRSDAPMSQQQNNTRIEPQQSRPSSRSLISSAASRQEQFQGVLWKRRDVFKKRWRPRWFVLQPSSGVLTYYLVQYDVVPRGTIYLRSCSVQADNHLSRPLESCYAFTITPPPSSNGSPCFLAAASQQERADWVEKLGQVCRVDIAEEEEEDSSDSVAESTPPIVASAPLSASVPEEGKEPEAEVDSWKDLEEDVTHALLVNVPEQLASRIQNTLETNLPLCSDFKPEHGWKTLFENRHGVSAYERIFDSHGRTMIKSTALVDHPPKQILNLLIDITRRRDFETNIQNYNRLKRFNAHTFLDYYAYRPVWPTSARDFVAAVHWRVLTKPKSGNKAICVMAFSWSDEEMQEVPNNVRGKLLVSLSLLEEVKENDTIKCRMTRILSLDLGGSVARSLNNTVLQQQTMLPFVISQHLSQTEPTPEVRLCGVLSNTSIINDVVDPLFAEGTNGAPYRRETFAEHSARGGKSFVVDSKKTHGSMGDSAEPSVLVVAIWLLAPLFLWQVASFLNLPNKGFLFLATALFAVRSVVLANAGRPCRVAGQAPGLVGRATCRFSVDLKGVLRFIANNKEERGEAQDKDAHEVSVIHVVIKAVAQAMSDVEELSSRRVHEPLLGIDGYFCPHKSGIDISVWSAKHGVESSDPGAIVTIEDATSMSIQEIADCLAEKEQQQAEDATVSRPTIFATLSQLLTPPSWIEPLHLGSCLVLAMPDSDHCKVDLDVVPSPRYKGVNVTAVVGGVRIRRGATNANVRRSSRAPAKPVLSMSLTIDCPICNIATCHRFAESVQKLVQFPEMCED